MAVPTVAARVLGTTTSNVFSETVAMPPGVAAGDLLLVIMANDGGTLSTPVASGWTLLGHACYSDDAGCAVFWRRATGADTCTVTGLNKERVSWCTFRILGAGDPTGTSSDGNTTTPDPPNHTAPSIADHLWIAAYGQDHSAKCTGYPAGWANTQQQVGDGGLGVTFASAERGLEASHTDNPAAFTTDDKEQWAAWTLAIPGVSTPAPTTNRGGFFPFL